MHVNTTLRLKVISGLATHYHEHVQNTGDIESCTAVLASIQDTRILNTIFDTFYIFCICIAIRLPRRV